jgi:hypothetical protein
MPVFRRAISFSRLVFWGGLMAVAAAAGRAENVRFSQQLTNSEYAEIGLPQLSSDQLAVLDALIRLDEKCYAGPGATPPLPARFSQRITAGDRENASLELLTKAQLERLDAVVARIEFGNVPDGASSVGAGSALQPDLKRPGLEIHGTISFMFGTGSGGRSEQGTALALEVDDPAHNFSAFIDYEQMRGKGPLLGRGGYGYPFYRDPVDALPDVIIPDVISSAAGALSGRR